ncbi:VOC family protein [Nocardia sp. NRRL WC-3656]|uniref:VOC family protein n=1 Tax=Nocardia sp. NRRL WC-3656 TaxID=1463824 RepID=UPI0009DD0350|nr:VOC family protein [Nocardia sp. NRRL WC-3656]
MTLIRTTGIHHIRLTITDIDRSRAFYEDVLGFTVVAESSGRPEDSAIRADPAQLYGGVVFETNGMLFGLRPVADRDDHFDSERVGLDHVSFTVDTIDDLHAIVQKLDEARIQRGDVTELDQFGIVILSFNDPDGIHLEVTAPMPPSGCG